MNVTKTGVVLFGVPTAAWTLGYRISRRMSCWRLNRYLLLIRVARLRGVGRLGRGFLFIEVSDLGFHVFPRLEGDDMLSRDVHLLASPRITSLSGRPRLHLENAKIPQFDPSLPNQGLDDRVKRFLDDFLRLLLSQTDLL